MFDGFFASPRISRFVSWTGKHVSFSTSGYSAQQLRREQRDPLLAWSDNGRLFALAIVFVVPVKPRLGLRVSVLSCLVFPSSLSSFACLRKPPTSLSLPASVPRPCSGECKVPFFTPLHTSGKQTADPSRIDLCLSSVRRMPSTTNNNMGLTKGSGGDAPTRVALGTQRKMTMVFPGKVRAMRALGFDLAEG